MPTRQTRYEEEFKRTLVELHHNGKSQTALSKEYGVSLTALNRWIKQYSPQIFMLHFVSTGLTVVQNSSRTSADVLSLRSDMLSKSIVNEQLINSG